MTATLNGFSNKMKNLSSLLIISLSFLTLTGCQWFEQVAEDTEKSYDNLKNEYLEIEKKVNEVGEEIDKTIEEVEEKIDHANQAIEHLQEITK